MQAWSGTGAFDKKSAGAQNTSASSLQGGTLTPAADNSLVVSFTAYASGGTETIDSPFTISDQQASSGSGYGCALAYDIQTTATARNPTWSYNSSNGCIVVNAAFGPAVSPPTNDTPAVIAGTVTVGKTLTATPGDWTGEDSVAGKWQSATTSGGVYSDIGGATSSTYVLVTGDTLKYIRYLETATNGSGSATQASNVLGPVRALPGADDQSAAVMMLMLN